MTGEEADRAEALINATPNVEIAIARRCSCVLKLDAEIFV
jgi:hypothetical protein